MTSKISTTVGYVIPLLLVYFFIYIPVFQTPSTRQYAGEEKTCDPDAISALKDFVVEVNPNISCPLHSYTTHIVNRDPLIIYILNFLSDDEADHLVDVSLSHFSPSTVYDGETAQVDPKIRLSEVALLPDADKTVQCLSRRAQAFQGFRPSVHIEKFRAQRYGLGGHYAHHYDWTGASKKSDRLSTFMVYLSAECEGGGTNFPRLGRPRGDEWCQWIECGEEDEEGLEGITFKPVKGSAVYFENLRPGGGGGYEETWHAGMPVKKGVKIGLNIWSWIQAC